MNADNCEQPGENLLRMLRDHQINLNTAEGLRLLVAFNRITDPDDRRTVIELAERLAR